MTGMGERTPGIGVVPNFGQADPEPDPPCGHKDGLGEFTGLPDSSGDVHPANPQAELNSWVPL